MLVALDTDPPPPAVELWERAREALYYEKSYTADPFFSAYHYKHRAGVLDTLEHWRRCAIMSANPQGYRRMLRRAARLLSAVVA